MEESKDLPKECDFRKFIDDSVCILEEEDSSYRKKDDAGFSGGLLDFSNEDTPVVIVPDLHGRFEFLLKLLDFTLPSQEKSILELLGAGKLFIVCAGDAVHSERRGYERWLSAYGFWQNGKSANDFMKNEMLENIKTWCIIMLLKKAFPRNFHFLKGNHENITNETTEANYSFRKFVQEGQMCRDFIEEYYGDALLHTLDLWEKNLPVCAIFNGFGISHAEPAENISLKNIVNYRKNGDTVKGLTWTNNDEIHSRTCRKILKSAGMHRLSKGTIWFGGHRPVLYENFSLRQEGDYIQFHNPEKMNIAYVDSIRNFDCEKNIISIEGGKK